MDKSLIFFSFTGPYKSFHDVLSPLVTPVHLHIIHTLFPEKEKSFLYLSLFVMLFLLVKIKALMIHTYTMFHQIFPTHVFNHWLPLTI